MVYSKRNLEAEATIAAVRRCAAAVVFLTAVTLTGCDGGSTAADPSPSPPATASTTFPAAASFPDGVTPVDGDLVGEPHQVWVDAAAITREGDVDIVYHGGIDTESGLQATVQVSTASEPGGQVRLYPGERIAFAGYVFGVNAETTAERLVLDVWTPAALSGVVPFYPDGVEPVAERPDAEPAEVVLAAPETNSDQSWQRSPGGVAVTRAGGPDKGSVLSIRSDKENQTVEVTVGTGDRFTVFGWVFEVVDSVEDESVTMLEWDLGAGS